MGLRCLVVGPQPHRCGHPQVCVRARRCQCVFVCLGVGVAPPTSPELVIGATTVCLRVSPAISSGPLISGWLRTRRVLGPLLLQAGPLSALRAGAAASPACPARCSEPGLAGPLPGQSRPWPPQGGSAALSPSPPRTSGCRAADPCRIPGMGWSLCFQRLFPPAFPPPPPAGWHPPPCWPSPSCLLGGRGWREWPGLGTHTQAHSYGHTQGHMGRHTQSRGHTPHTKSHIHSYSHTQSWMCSHPQTSHGRPPADILCPPHPQAQAQ